MSLVFPTEQENHVVNFPNLFYNHILVFSISMCEILLFYCRTPLKGFSEVDGSARKSSPTREPSSGDSLKENQCDSNSADERQARRINEHARNVKKALQMKRSSSSDL